MFKGCLLIGFFIGLSSRKFCYHKKCRTLQYEYIDCDQQYYECKEYDVLKNEEGSCEYQGSASYGGYESCSSSKNCSTDPDTGKAKCFQTWNYSWDSYERGMSVDTTLVLIIISVTVGMIVLCCIGCFCFARGCRSNNEGRAAAPQPETKNDQNGGVVVQTTADHPGQEEMQAANQCPLAQNPPAISCPPTQHTPAGGYPLTRYPPPLEGSLVPPPSLKTYV